MDNKIKVVLCKAYWCGHCNNFMPIYEKAIKLSKKNRELQDVEFEMYDLEVDNEKNNFLNTYPKHFIEEVKGFPTIFLITKENDELVGDNIDHTVLENDNSKDEETLNEEAAKRFLNRVINAIKTKKSGNKILYTEGSQTGGRCKNNNFNTNTNNDEQIKYREKYIKYKNKYLKLLQSNK